MRVSALVVTAAVALLAGCTETAAPTPPPPAPEVVAFSVSPTAVKAGESTTVSWQTKNATTVELLQVGVGQVSGASGTSGSVAVAVQEDALFVLIARNERGVEASAAAAVQVDEPAKGVLFIVTPDSVDAGAPATLAWSAPGARDVRLATREGATVALDGQREVGAVTVRPARSTTYVLTVDGVEYARDVIVRPGIGAFVATPSSVKGGETVTLSWQTSGAAAVDLLLSATGTLYTETDTAKVADGSFTFAVPAAIDPAAALTFTLVARDDVSGVHTSQDLTVFVTGAPKVREFNVPAYARLGSTFQLSWKTTGADRVEILREGTVVFRTESLAQADAGSATFPSPAVESRYVVRAINARGAVDESERILEPVGLPSVTAFTASPQPGIQNGGEPVTLTWDVPYARNLKIVAEGQYTLVSLTGKAAQAGSIQAYPNKDTTWRLEADNAIGDAIAPQFLSATVATPATLAFDPASAPLGTAVTVSAPGLANATEIELVNIRKNVSGAAFVDISTTGVDIDYSGPDTTAKKITLPEIFSTRLFGKPIASNQITISINGWFVFGSSTKSLDSPVQLPTNKLDPYTIAPFFDDLYDNATSEIFYKIDTVGTEKRLIVQWDKVEYDPVTSSSITFQAQVFDSGRIVFAYKSMRDAAAATPGIGVQNDTFTEAVTAPAATPADGDTYTLTTWRGSGRTALPGTVIVGGSDVVARVYFADGGFTEIEQHYPVIPQGLFRITEVNVSPASTVSNGQWFEVENAGAQPVDLTGWTLNFGSSTHTIASGTVIPASGRLVFAQSSGAGDGIPVDYVYGTGFTIPAGGTVSLNIGAVTYSSFALPQASLMPGRTWQLGPLATGMTPASGLTRLECAAAASSAYGTQGQLGTPGTPNTPCMNFDAPVAIPANFEPIATTGTALQFGNLDDGIATIQLATPVLMDGVSYSSIMVSTNGYLSLAPMACDGVCWSTNKTAPNPAPTDAALPPYGFVAPYWDDNDLSAHGGVYWERKVPNLQPNDGYTIVSWENVHHFTSATDNQTGDDLNFQVKFFDTGNVEFHFGTMVGEDGSSATTWLENPTSKAAFIVNVNSANAPGIQSNTAYRFAAK